MKKTIGKRKNRNLYSAPGTITYTGTPKNHSVIIHHLNYDQDTFLEKDHDSKNKISFEINQGQDNVSWYDIRGIHDTDLLGALGEAFKIHPLALEKVADPKQRPSFEEYDRGVLLIAKAMWWNETSKSVNVEQVGIYFREGLVISFQENESDLFDAVRKRIKEGTGRVRKKGADYLAFALLDSLSDRYFPVVDPLEETVTQMEEELLKEPTQRIKEEIHRLRKQVYLIRRNTNPIKEALNRLEQSETEFIKEENLVFFRSLREQFTFISENVESTKVMLESLQELFMSEVGMRMNTIMKILTIISAVFIPLTFLAGVYGMNFDTMPGTKHPQGFYILMAVLLVILLIQIWMLKKQKWF